MPTRIREVRITLAWFERLTGIWRAGAPVAMSFLQTPEAYAKQFESVTAGGRGDTLTLPWPLESSQYRHWFWTYYLQRAPQTISGAEAFRQLVPLRSGFDCKMGCEKPWVSAIADAFYYPHGIGLVVTVKLFLDSDIWPKTGVSLETAVQKSIESWSDYQYNLTWASGPPLRGTMDLASRELMRHVRERVMAPQCPEGAGDPKPFSIAAVVRGNFDRPDQAPAAGGDLHEAMQGLCILRTPWQKVNLYPLKDAALRIRRSIPKGHFLYHSDRGRALWFPSYFAENAKARNRSIGCYQRNLTLLHLQTMSLIDVLRSQTDLAAAGGEKSPAMLAGMAAEAAQQLSALYASTQSTYRSSSPRAYIDEHPEIKTLVENALGRKLTYTETAT